MPIDAPIVVSPLAVTMREWVKKVLGGQAVNYADGLRNKKNPAGGVNYCWVMNHIQPYTLENIKELVRLANTHPRISMKITNQGFSCAPGKIYRAGSVYIRCKVRAE